MADNVIHIENLSKKYILRHQTAGRSNYVALRDIVAEKTASLFRRKKTVDAAHEEFWALRDVSLNVQRGESVGIIGRNGAGKSTLLKILSRITEPTSGRIEINGRVASLLEVGTGFHPELTGRENIYLNGAILGMKRAEIKKKFDEIVAFAEVEKFLDTPVKHFSSGMYVRLAFSVAAHLESEILILDEVLAVGDMQFQKKCFGKMEDITGNGGRTVLFVSHNMDMITKLCTKALLLKEGRPGTLDSVDKVTQEYLSQANSLSGKFTAKNATRSLRSAEIDQNALQKERLVIKIGFRFSMPVSKPTFGVVIYTEGGSPVFGSNTMFQPPVAEFGSKTEGEVTVTFDHLPLWSGSYLISIWLSDGWTAIDHEESALIIEFVSSTAPLNAPSSKYIGPVLLPAQWEAVS
jgi:lipopolysaccharide transport system ATP-binding protein